jgi:6-phosphogluconolactonase
MSPAGLAGEAVNPSFLAIHPNRRFLYAVSEVNRNGVVISFSLDASTGKLAPINQTGVRGSGPCYVAVDRSGKDVLVANYGSGSFAVMPVKDDGSLGEISSFVQDSGTVADRKRQGGPHAHSINLSLDNRFAIGADLGLDKLFVFRFDPAAGSITANEPPSASVAPRSGPRHFAFHPSGKYGYVINEIGNSVTAFSYNAANGVLSEIQTVSTLPADFHGQSDCAEVQVHPSGKFLYGSNRGHNSIAVFAIDAGKGTLTPVEYVPTGGKVPRNFGVDPSGNYLIAANQDSNNLVVFKIDAKTGRLKATGQEFEVYRPVCVKFLALK